MSTFSLHKFSTAATGNQLLACIIVFLACICILSPNVNAAEETTAADPKTAAPAATEQEARTTREITWEFDPYYTNIGVYIPLTDTPIPTITSDNEFVIYSKLIEGSAIPRYMLLEASVYPMPMLGTYLKSNTPEFYNNWEIGKGGTNMLQAATAGFQEPWAVSAFFGNIAKLVRPGTAIQANNLGYSGYLVSAGSKHIKDNVMVDDIWYELEWKIKGKREYHNDKQIWSFRAGGKFHDNPYITDVAYVSIHRNNLNSRFSFFDWVKNTEIDMKLHFSQTDGEMVRMEMIFGKKYPIENKDYTPTLNVGLIWASPNEYSGILRDQKENTVTVVFRPSIEF